MRVLVVRLGSMGDVLHALPAVAALRAAHPDAEIGWAIERRWTSLLVADGCPLSGWPTVAGVARVGNTPQRPLVDHVHIVDTLAWRKALLSDETWAEVRNVVRDMRALRYDVAIDFQGSIKSAVVAQLSGASSRVGFASPREKPASMFYTSVVQPFGRHVIDKNLSLIATLVAPPFRPVLPEGGGFPIDSRQSAIGNILPLDPAAESEVSRKLSFTETKDQRPAARFAILNPGAGWPAKQWPAARYAEVARALAGDGMISLVNYGPGEETLAREVEEKSGSTAHLIFCTLAELIALTRRASLFIGGDTGPMHLAVLLGVPVVALFGPTDPTRNGPYPGCPTLADVARVGSKGTSITLRHPDSRTTTAHSSEPDPGLLQITSDEVIRAARMLLTRVPHPDRLWKGGPQ